VAWTVVGCGIALVQGDVAGFLHEWFLLQGFPLVTVGTWLLILVRSTNLEARVADLTPEGSTTFRPLEKRAIGLVIAISVGMVGTASLIPLGFRAHGSVLAFMWFTCTCVCCAAGFVTVHAIDILRFVHGLPRHEVKVSRYAPARTPELRSFVSYFSSFTLLMTLGYAAALVATLNPDWTGPKDYVEAVRLFWPVIYVPICSVALIYPHLAVHRLIQREKERTLSSCQRDINVLLEHYGELKKEDIERTNALAQLFERITSTPDYVVDLGIAFRTLLPLAFNVVTLVAKAAIHHP
jgi:hypothetical protein